MKPYVLCEALLRVRMNDENLRFSAGIVRRFDKSLNLSRNRKFKTSFEEWCPGATMN